MRMIAAIYPAIKNCNGRKAFVNTFLVYSLARIVFKFKCLRILLTSALTALAHFSSNINMFKNPKKWV